MRWWERLLGFQPPEVKAALEVSPELVVALGSSWPWGSYGAMYRLQPAVRTVIDFLARNIAQLNPKVYEKRDRSDRRELDNHPLAALLHNPNPNTTRYRHLRDTVSDLAIYDRAYWLKVAPRGQLQAIVRVAPPLLTQVTDQRTGNTVYEGPNGQRFARDNFVIFEGYNPDGSDQPVPPLETLRRVLAEEWASVSNRERFWRNSARQSGWVERPNDAPQLSDTAFERTLERLNMMVSGDNAGRVGLLEEGMKWNGQAFSPRDSEYVAGRMLTLAEVCRLYGGGALMAMIGAGTDTKASVEARHREGYQDVFGPWLRHLQDEIELQLLPEVSSRGERGSIYVEFNLAEKLKGSFEEQSASLISSVGVPYMTPNEGRARLNLPRIEEEWADVPVQPLNVMYGGQPAVNVPVEEPNSA